jgi:hypothetical protein
MSARRYFQLSFLLPLVLPLLVRLLWSTGFRGWGSVILIIWGSLLIGGIPYVFFIGGLFFWMRNKDYKAIQRMTFIAPLLFALLFFCIVVFIIVPLQMLSTGQVRAEGNALSGFCILILIVGYFYVLLTNAGFYLLKGLGYIAEEAEWEGALRRTGRMPKVK